MIYSKLKPSTYDDSLIGRKVVRSSEWACGEQDGGAWNIGTITGRSGSGSDNWVRVKWPNGHTNAYQFKDIEFIDLPDLERKKSIETRMQKHIPGFFIGCNIECVKLPRTSGSLKIGTIVTPTTSLDHLEECILSFDSGFSSLIDLSNKYMANYESGCFKAVGYKEECSESLLDLVGEMQMYIPGFYVGCTLKIVKPTGYTHGQVGRTFTTKGLTESDLKRALKLFSIGQRSSSLDPNNTYATNYLPEQLEVVEIEADWRAPKEVFDKLLEDDIHVILTPRAEHILDQMWAGGTSWVDPYESVETKIPSEGYIMPVTPKEAIKNKFDSSFNIEFVDFQLHKPGKKSKIKF